MSKVTPEQIDALLPQIQCGLCGHGGCMPYAEAIIFENAPINLCPPGGITTLHALGQLLAQDPGPYEAEIAQKTRPPMRAFIREDECIGCTKCIQACPVDAILGSAKHMHTIISQECTGCELCVPPCPVDCIDMITLPEESPDEVEKKKNGFRKRFNQRQQRLSEENKAKKAGQASLSLSKKQAYVQAAITRAKAKKRR